MIPGAIVYTFLHEGLHAAAAIIQGGELTEFVFWPSEGQWGHVRYRFAEGEAYSELAILMAPYVLPVILLSVGVCMICCLSMHHQRARRAVYVWLFLVPAFDLAYAAIPYECGDMNDFYYAFGRPSPTSFGVMLSFGFLLGYVGYILQKKVHRDERLSVQAYLLLAVLALFLVFLL